jgi:hypothetical protein
VAQASCLCESMFDGQDLQRKRTGEDACATENL